MKALRFLGNRVEDAANAFIDVLKYSDQSVDYPDFNDIEPWPEDIVKMFEHILKTASFSETTAILMNHLAPYDDRADYDDVMYFLNKLVADEEHHIKLLKEAMGISTNESKGVTVIIK